MGSLFLYPTSILEGKLSRISDRRGWHCTNGSSWKNTVCCLRNKNGKTSSRLSSMPMPNMVNIDHGTIPTDAQDLVLLSNEKTKEEILEKNLMPYSGTTTMSMENSDGIRIGRFLKGKRILVTGATGFFGKVLVEKILRTTPEVGKIFLMIRARNKECAKDRLMNEIINSELFKCLQQTHQKNYQTFMLSKLVPVEGNLYNSNLGMEEDLAEEIAGEVDVILNSAANTTFDDRYDVTLNMNTRGPYRLMSFAKSCKNLKLFLQVSTAYVNGERQGRILEKPFRIGESIAMEMVTYPSGSIPLLDVEAEIKLALDSKQDFQEHGLRQKMKELGLQRARIYGWQDTYVFTKAMGEMLLNNMRGEIPLVIVRPSVIESTYREPFPGWIEGNRMLDPLISHYGKGQLTSLLADPKAVIDVVIRWQERIPILEIRTDPLRPGFDKVPADVVVNATLAAMAKHGTAGEPGINIYHICSSVVNPLVLQDLFNHVYEHFKSSPYMDSRRPVHVQKMKFVSSMEDFSLHVSKDASQQSRKHGKLSQRPENPYKKIVEQVKYIAKIYEPYTFYAGRFDNTNTQKLVEDMSEEERRSFGCDVGIIDWKDYFCNIHIPGLRRHVLK